MILITGGLGYLGGRIATSLIGQGSMVRLGSSRIDPQIPIELRNCHNVHTDFTSQDSLNLACQEVDTIIHLAGMNAPACGKNPERALLLKGVGTQKLLLAAQLNSVKKIIYFSTVHVYGSRLIGALDEYSLPRPSHPYSITHRLAEDLVLEVNDKTDIEGIVFRLSNAVGSPVSPDADCWTLVVNDLCRQIVSSGEMNLKSNKDVQRDYVSISYITDVLSRVITDDSLSNALAGRISNMSSGESISLGDLVSLIQACSQITLGVLPKYKFSAVASDDQDLKPLSILSNLERFIDPKSCLDLSTEISHLLLNCRNWFGNESI
jgi:UDP-glucose 4-epimerase